MAFSDHSQDEMDIAARSLGADMTEKTITLTNNCKLRAYDVIRRGRNECVKALRELDVALGKSKESYESDQKQFKCDEIRVFN